MASKGPSGGSDQGPLKPPVLWSQNPRWRYRLPGLQHCAAWSPRRSGKALAAPDKKTAPRVDTAIGWQRVWSGKNSSFVLIQSLLRSRNVFCVMALMAQGAHRGRPVAAAPCTPGLWPPKSPLRGSFDLSRQASGRAEAASVQNTALSPHPCGLPRPSGNVSAILRPPTPAVSASAVKTLKAGRKDRRSGKALAATRQKNDTSDYPGTA